MKLNKFISGTELMKLCDICVFESDQNENWGSCCKYIYNIDKNPTKESLEQIQKAKKIFIKRLHRNTDYVVKFLNIFYKFLSNDVILITHCSDYGIFDMHHNILDLPKIKAWYGMNCHTNHPKLFSIPIGMTTCDKAHGNMDLLNKIVEEKNKKNNLLYVNCDVRSNPLKRKAIIDLMKEKGYTTIIGEKPLSQDEYWRHLASSKFVISPPGNGVDCHRIWESIYLGTIPIVERHSVLKDFKNMPILFIDDWNVINDTYLNLKYNEMKDKVYDTSKCYMKYWEENVN
jgi:hypothetical protein